MENIVSFETSSGNLLLRENPSDMSSTGSKVWPCSMTLTRYLQNNRSKLNFKGKRVMELGAGCGLPSLYLGSLGAKCIMTDLQSMLYLLNANASLNSHLFEEPVKVQEYAWGTDASVFNPPFDFCIGCDVVFQIPYVKPLVDSLIQLCDTKTTVFISVEKREPAAWDLFFEEVEKSFSCKKIPQNKLDNTDKDEPLVNTHFCTTHTMNKLYDAIEPTVIDDELIRNKCIQSDSSLSEKKLDTSGSGLKKETYHLEFAEVEHLKFSFLNIYKIENLVGFDKLAKLQLDNNIIDKIDNLSHLTNLTWLDLSFNSIKKIEGLSTLTKLTDLSLASNQIKAIEGLDNLVNLQCLSLGKNLISNIKEIICLRKLPKLAVLNLAKNPIDKVPEYKSYILAYVSSLKYLDFRLVDEAAQTQAREQYQDEILRLKEEDGLSGNNKILEKSEQERMALLKEANLTSVATIFAEMMREDPEVAHYRFLPQMEDTLSEYAERVTLLTDDFTKSMLTHHANHTKETQQFARACKLAQSGSDKSALELIDKFNKNFKKVKSAVKNMAHPTPAEKAQIEELKKQNTALSTQLLDLEIQLVEQHEEFSKEFERRMADINGAKMEVVQAYFAKLRDTENGFHDRSMSIAMSEIEKFNKDELEGEVNEATKQLLSDKETLSNMINASHDVQSLLIDSKEDDMTKFLSKQLEALITNTKKEENQRNRNRVSEISLLVSRNNAQIQTPD